jgi:hypothetical protein
VSERSRRWTRNPLGSCGLAWGLRCSPSRPAFVSLARCKKVRFEQAPSPRLVRARLGLALLAKPASCLKFAFAHLWRDAKRCGLSRRQAPGSCGLAWGLRCSPSRPRVSSLFFCASLARSKRCPLSRRQAPGSCGLAWGLRCSPSRPHAFMLAFAHPEHSASPMRS